jgi:ATP synthase protein I
VDEDQKRLWQLAGRYGAVGLEMGLSVAFGLYAGTWLDRKFGTDPWLTVALGVVGFGAAVKAVYDAVKRYKVDMSD